MRTYHIGIVDGGRGRAIVEVADTVDQLHCETLAYLGERETTIAGLRERIKRDQARALNAVREITGREFAKVVVWRVAPSDFTAGHKQ